MGNVLGVREFEEDQENRGGRRVDVMMMVSNEAKKCEIFLKDFSEN
jgi:hypothetical protein